MRTRAVSIAEQMRLALTAHERLSAAAARAHCVEVLTIVGMPDAERRLDAYPHQFSGGMRQRVAIAIALLHRPPLIIADEPTTALDVSIQAQILTEVKILVREIGTSQRIATARALAMQPEVIVCDEPVASLAVSIQAQIINLFLRLRRELSRTMLFISHDLSVVKHLCDRVMVMYLGRIVETAEAAALYAAPLHPYTQGLLTSIPKLRIDEEPVTYHPIAGELPSPLSPPPGCHFHTRCPLVVDRCRSTVPPLVPVGDRREGRLPSGAAGGSASTELNRSRR